MPLFLVYSYESLLLLLALGHGSVMEMKVSSTFFPVWLH